MSNFYPHQISSSDKLVTLLKQYGVAYLFGEPRTGKTRTAFRTVNLLPVKKVMFVTKKNAVPGIAKELHVCKKPVTVINYEQISKYDKSDYDFVILDEAHNISSVGKPSKRYKELKAFCWDKPVLLLSGTPMVETPLSAYYQFGVTKYTPLQFKTFYDFFRHWGIPSLIFLQGRQIEQYKKARPELQPFLDPLIVRLTQDDAGITAQAEDVVHTVTLTPSTIAIIDRLKKEAIATAGTHEIICESEAAVRAAIHQIESGAMVLNNCYVMLDNTEIVDYIKATFGNSPDIACMCHYNATKEKIAQHLPNVHVYSSDGSAEGVDLSHYKHFVIVNTGYSGAKHVQRRDRGTRIDVKTPRKVHHIICKGQLSEAVYKQVSRKLSFNINHLRKFIAC